MPFELTVVLEVIAAEDVRVEDVDAKAIPRGKIFSQWPLIAVVPESELSRSQNLHRKGV